MMEALPRCLLQSLPRPLFKDLRVLWPNSLPAVGFCAEAQVPFCSSMEFRAKSPIVFMVGARTRPRCYRPVVSSENISTSCFLSRDTGANARTRNTRRKHSFDRIQCYRAMESPTKVATSCDFRWWCAVVMRWWSGGGPVVVPRSRSRLAKERGHRAARPFRVLWRLLESRVELSNQVDELYRGHDRDHRCR